MSTSSRRSAADHVLHRGVFIVAPLMIATGPDYEPGTCGRFPGYVPSFRNRQTARSIHFLGMAFYCVCTCPRSIPVQHRPHGAFSNKPYNEVGRSTVRLRQSPCSLAALSSLWLCGFSLRTGPCATYDSPRPHLGPGLQPICNLLTVSPPAQKKTFTDAGSSPFHLVNTRPLTERESTEWNRRRSTSLRLTTA